MTRPQKLQKTGMQIYTNYAVTEPLLQYYMCNYLCLSECPFRTLALFSLMRYLWGSTIAHSLTIRYDAQVGGLVLIVSVAVLLVALVYFATVRNFVCFIMRREPNDKIQFPPYGSYHVMLSLHFSNSLPLHEKEGKTSNFFVLLRSPPIVHPISLSPTYTLCPVPFLFPFQTRSTAGTSVARNGALPY